MNGFCIVSFCNIYQLPYAKIYIDMILKSGSNCTLLFWDRDAVHGQNDIFPKCKKLCYELKITPSSSKSLKIAGYFGSTLYFRKILNKANFKGIIFLQTHAAVVCKDILERKYINKYIVDIRDFTWENNGVYYSFETNVINGSFATVVSSPAYKKFLPKKDYIIAHNFTPFDETTLEKIRNRNKTDNFINISFVGTIRFIEMDKKILTLFANDNRFSINYFGTGSEVLCAYCKEKMIKNTKFYGAFPPEMTSIFYKNTDLINNLYGNHDKFLDYALSNKTYHAAQFYIPILVCPDTYMEKVVLQYDLGYVFDVEDKDAPNRLYSWYTSLDKKKLIEGSDLFIKVVKKDNVNFYGMIESFVN